MTIHVFGDSHASDKISGWKDCLDIESHYLGPILCYSFGQEKRKRLDINKYDIKDDDIVLFCFGEIDCRCHVHKYITPQQDYKEIINQVIHNYILAIKENIRNCKAKLKYVYVYNVVPPVRKESIRQHKKYPHLGSDQERQKYVLYFNQKLQEVCDDNIRFFNIYDKYVDKDGFLNPELSDGSVHIFDGKYLQEFIDSIYGT